MADKIRWGIIGTAKIAKSAVIPAIKQSSNGVVAAVASRDLAKAKAYAKENGIERAYGSYEALLADPEIDAIYNPLPNDGHQTWGIATAKAGKPSLIEKPLGRNADEAQMIVGAFKKAKLPIAEAFMYRYHPQHAKVRELLAQDVIGPLNLIDTCFTFSLPQEDTANVRLNKELGGGGLLDVGCYCVNLCRSITGQEPIAVTGQAIYGQRSEVDEWFVGTLRFPGRVLARFECGVRSYFRNSYTLSGPLGSITAETSFRPADDGEAVITVRRQGQEPETIVIPPVNQYTLMVEDFADAVLNERPVTYDPIDAVRNMRVLDALAKAAREEIVLRL